MSEKISVIIPVYNSKKYLNKCITSVLNQSYQNIEVILVDDGSTDSSGEICDEYEKMDNRVKTIHKKNGGPSECRNVGLKVATGKYIGFLYVIGGPDRWAGCCGVNYLHPATCRCSMKLLLPVRR